MNELSIAISLIDEVLEETKDRDLAKVEAVHLRIGVFSGVDVDALTTSYGLASQGTALEGSHLEIKTVPLVVYCPSCATERPAQSPSQLNCGICFTPAERIVQGRELYIVAIEVAA
jgi:hydrogenase nickel incorporation protein HypA/HybF